MALKDAAFLLDGTRNTLGSLCELKPQQQGDTTKEVKKGSSDDADDAENQQKSEDELSTIHAIGVIKRGEYLFCALAKGDKSLSIYKMNTQEILKSEVHPSMIYNTPKRLSCMNFTQWPSDDDKSTPTTERPMILLAGDMTGDAYAYNLESKGQSLLLGHTASMLTGLCVVNGMLLTSDRDEKIRVSSFPQTIDIEGFLLGHGAYITAVVASPEKGTVITASGDSTIRAWNLMNQAELSVLSFESENDNAPSLIPADMSLNEDGTLLAVIFDDSNRLDIYTVDDSQDSAKLQLLESVECASQPLGVRSQGLDCFFVAQSDPTFLSKLIVKDGKATEEFPPFIQTLRKTAAERGIAVPTAILERDPYGQIKLAKRHEARGPTAGGLQPWNRVERVETSKEASKRSKKRRKERSFADKS